jgi:Flp pilus assembly pilin Flp
MRQWLRDLRGQSILEYSILVAMVAAAFVAMSMYVQRATQGRVTQIDEAITPKPKQATTYTGWPWGGASGGGSSWPW